MTTFLAIVTIVAGVLQIILFFKIWGMTNNVSKLTAEFCGEDTEDNGRGIQVNSHVKRNADGVTMIVVEKTNGKYSCMYPGSHKDAGTYNENEISIVRKE